MTRILNSAVNLIFSSVYPVFVDSCTCYIDIYIYISIYIYICIMHHIKRVIYIYILVLLRGCSPIIPSTQGWESSGVGDGTE